MATKFLLKQIKPFNVQTVTADIAAKIMSTHWINYLDADIKAETVIREHTSTSSGKTLPFGVSMENSRTNICFRIFENGAMIISSIVKPNHYQTHNIQPQLIQKYLDLGFFSVDIITE